MFNKEEIEEILDKQGYGFEVIYSELDGERLKIKSKYDRWYIKYETVLNIRKDGTPEWLDKLILYHRNKTGNKSDYHYQRFFFINGNEIGYCFRYIWEHDTFLEQKGAKQC